MNKKRKSFLYLHEEEISRQILASSPPVREIMDILDVKSSNIYYRDLIRFYLLKGAFHSGISIFRTYLVSLLLNNPTLKSVVDINHLREFLEVVHFTLENPEVSVYKSKKKLLAKPFKVFLNLSAWFALQFPQIPEVEESFPGIWKENIPIILNEYINLVEALYFKDERFKQKI